MSSHLSTVRQIQIRKYPNRRFYDTTRCQYVTMEEIHGFVREGYDVAITCSETNKDITVKVLTQIILELDALKGGVFPVSLLHKFLHSLEKMAANFVQHYLHRPLDSFLSSQRSMEQLVRLAMGLPTGSPVADAAQRFWSSLTWVPLAAKPAEVPMPPADEAELWAAVEQMREQLVRLRGGKKGTGRQHHPHHAS